METQKQHLPPSLILVTGAAGGLGKAFAVECASRGWDVALSDLRREGLETLAESLRNTYGVRVWVFPCDLTDPTERSSLLSQVEREGLRFWGLVNVAGLDFEGPFLEQSRQAIRTIIRLNIEGTLDLTHGLLALRDPLACFRIINVASLAAFYPMPVKATYAASKRFLVDFSLALRNELRDLGVTVTALCPAGMPTTPETVQAIDSQGILGQLTTLNTGAVANQALNAALKGQALVIPGRLNQMLQLAGRLAPTGWVVSLIGSRWRASQAARKARAQVMPALPVSP